MKRLIALITMIAIAFSFTAVYAEPSVEEMYMQMMTTPITEANEKMTIRLETDGGIFDLLSMAGTDASVIKALLNSSIDCEVNVLANEELTKMSADGRVVFNSGAQELAPTFAVDVWLNMDVSNIESIQYFAIIKAADPNAESLMGDKYILLDYAKVPGFKEIIRTFVEMGLFDREKMESMVSELVDEEKLMELYQKLLKDVELNMTYADGKYSLVMGDAEVKKLFGTLFNNLLDFAIELSGEEVDAAELQAAKAELAAALEPVANTQFFDPERGLVLEVTVDGENKIATEHMEINLDFNLMELAEVFEPGAADAAGMPAEMFDLSISLIADATVNALPDGYSVNFPKLDNSNSMDVFVSAYGDAASYGYIPGADDNIKISYNGTVVELENKPVMLNDRTFVPVRRLANMLGISDEYISYDDATQRVYIDYEGVNIEMYLGSSVAYVNGEMKVLDVPAFTLEDRTYIPVRFVSEMFGKSVGYEESNGVQMITIND